MRVSLPAMPRFGGFCPLFTRSIKAQDKRPQSQAPAARLQSPAVQGFSGKCQPQSVWRFYKIIAVGHPEKSRVSGLCGDFDRRHRKERRKMDDNKKSTTIWLRPSVISRMDGWLEADNCQSRSEFVDKALRFYMGYLGTEDNTTYISQAILTAIQGTMDLNNHRLQTILFKCAVELNMLCHTIAAHFRADPIHTRELRAYAVDEVKLTNGQVSFESAVRQQRRIEPEDEWAESY